MLQRKEEPGFLYMSILNRSLTLRLGKEKSIKRFAVFGDSQNDFYSPLAFKGGKLFKEPIAPYFRHTECPWLCLVRVPCSISHRQLL